MFSYSTVNYDESIKAIGVVADTHVPSRGESLPCRLFEELAGVGLIIHAGDLVCEQILSELGTLAPVEAVAGNMDPPHLQERLGHLKLIRVGGKAIGLLHGNQAGRRLDPARVAELFGPVELQAVVFGHLHVPLVRREEGILYFNPGSAVDPRRGTGPTCGRLTIGPGGIEACVIDLA